METAKSSGDGQVARAHTPNRNKNQGLASPHLNWDAPDGRGHGVPVLGVDGYEYVR